MDAEDVVIIGVGVVAGVALAQAILKRQEPARRVSDDFLHTLEQLTNRREAVCSA